MRGIRTARSLWLVAIAIICAPALTFGQWLKLPTPDVPKKADGTPNMAAPTPRLPDGKPDLSGIWHATNLTRCGNRAGAEQFLECGVEIGGSLLAGDLGRDLPGGLPYRPHAAALCQGPSRRRQPRRSARALPARQPAAGVDAAAPDPGHPHAEAAGAALRGERDVPPDPHRRPAAAGGHDAGLERLLDGALGRRHAGGADGRLPGRPVDRHVGQPDERPGQDDGTDHAGRTTAPWTSS